MVSCSFSHYRHAVLEYITHRARIFIRSYKLSSIFNSENSTKKCNATHGNDESTLVETSDLLSLFIPTLQKKIVLSQVALLPSFQI